MPNAKKNTLHKQQARRVVAHAQKRQRKRKAPRASIESLPNEALEHILFQMDSKNVIKMCSVNRNMAAFCRSPTFWRRWAERYHGIRQRYLKREVSVAKLQKDIDDYLVTATYLDLSWSEFWSTVINNHNQPRFLQVTVIFEDERGGVSKAECEYKWVEAARHTATFTVRFMGFVKTDHDQFYTTTRRDVLHVDRMTGATEYIAIDYNGTRANPFPDLRKKFSNIIEYVSALDKPNADRYAQSLRFTGATVETITRTPSNHYVTSFRIL